MILPCLSKRKFTLIYTVPHNLLNFMLGFQPIAHAAKRQSPSGTEGQIHVKVYLRMLCVRQALMVFGF